MVIGKTFYFSVLPFNNFPLSEPTFASKSIIDKFGINDFGPVLMVCNRIIILIFQK